MKSPQCQIQPEGSQNMNTISNKIRFVPLACALLVSLLFLPELANAATSYDANATGTWSSTSIWTPAGTPGSTDTVTVGSGFTVTVDDTQSISVLNLSTASSSDGTLIVDTTGDLTADGTVRLGTAAGANGALTVDTGGTFASTSSDAMVLGYLFGTGELNINGGTVTSTGLAYLGNFGTSASGTVNVTSGGSWTGASGMYVGRDGTGALNISDGSIDVGAAGIFLGTNGTGNGTATVSGTGALSVVSTLAVGNDGTGTLNLTGGNVGVGTTLFVGRFVGSTGTVNFGTGGTVGTLTTGVGGVVGGAGTATVNFNHTGSYTNSLEFSGALSVNKLGTGTTTLSGTNTYTGATLISAGTLLLDSTGVLANTSGVTVSGGALTIGAADRINDAATMTLSGGTFNTGGFSETLDALTLANSTTSSLDFGSGASILLFSGITTDTGTLAITNWTFGSDSLRFTSGLNLSASSFTVNGGGATILDQGSYYEVVPEPGTLALLALTGTFFMVIRRRRA